MSHSNFIRVMSLALLAWCLADAYGAPSLYIDVALTSATCHAWGDDSSGQTNVPLSMTNATRVAAGAYHSLALLENGRVVAWGLSSSGQTNVPPSVTNAIDIAAGWNHSLAVLSNGSVVGWGNNGNKQIKIPADLTNAVAVAGGWKHSVALRRDGTVIAWGNNSAGEINVPNGLGNIIAIAAGRSHTLALRDDGRVYAWGDNTYGQTDLPGNLTNVVAIDGGANYSMALCADGHVVAWGHNGSGQTNIPSSLSNVVAVSAGGDHALALRSDGRVVAWGDNSSGQTNLPTAFTNVVSAISAGRAHSLALMIPAHTLEVRSPYGECVPAAGMHWVSRDRLQTCSVDQTTIAEGGTQYVNTGWSGTGSVPSAGSSNSVSFEMSQSGAMSWLWETNHWLEAWSTGGGAITAVDGWYSSESTVLIRATNVESQSLVGWYGDTNGCTINGLDLTVPMSMARRIEARFTAPIINVQPTSLLFTGLVVNARETCPLTISNAGDGILDYTIASDFWLSVDNPTGSLAAGQSTNHVVTLNARRVDPLTFFSELTVTGDLATNSPIVLKVTHQHPGELLPSCVLGWGTNNYRQVEAPAGLTNVLKVSAGSRHSMALQSGGRVVCWGFGSSGQTIVPEGLSNIVAIAAGDTHSLALQHNRTVVAWGDNADGESTMPVDMTNVIAIAAGHKYSSVLQQHGKVVVWGYEFAGATNVPAGLSNVIAIAAGFYHVLALRVDGTVVAWGYNGYGQTNVSTDVTNAVAIAAGTFHSLALRANGTVVAWGRNDYGQTNVPAGLSNVVAIQAGWYHSLALCANGTVVCWGDNSYFQTNTPTGLGNVSWISGGYYHSMAVASALVFTVTSAVGVPVPQAGNHAILPGRSQFNSVSSPVTVDGTQYVCTGWAGSGSVPPSGNSTNISVILTNNSTITWLWQPTHYSLDLEAVGGGVVDDINGWYQPGTRMTVEASPVSGETFIGWFGDTNDCVIDGTILHILMTATRKIEARFTAPAFNVTPAALVFTGETYQVTKRESVIAVSNVGTQALTYSWTSDVPWCVVSNGWATLEAGAATTHAVRVSADYWKAGTYEGQIRTVNLSPSYVAPITLPIRLVIRAVPAPTRVIAWGRNEYGLTDVPADLTNAIAVSANHFHSLALKDDGTVTEWGAYGQDDVPVGLKDVTAISAGWWHALALRSNGTVVTWNGAEFPQSNIPIDLTNAVAIAAGGHHSMALRSNGRVACWGWSIAQDLTNVPSSVRNVTAIAAGYRHAMALLSNGTVVAWSSTGTETVPAGLSNVVDIAVGYYFFMARQSNGSIVSWGFNTAGQTNVPSSATNVVAMAAGYAHSLVLRADRSVVGWGSNTYGQATAPLSLSNALAISAGQHHSIALMPVPLLDVSSEHGQPKPTAGPHWLLKDSWQTCSVASPESLGGTQYVCTGWSGTGSVPTNGTSNSTSFTLTEVSTIAWQWGQTNIWLNLDVVGGGQSGTTSGWYSVGSALTVTVAALPGYEFVGWTGETNDCLINGMTAIVPMTAAHSVRARFTGPAISVQPTTLAFTGQVDAVIAGQTLLVSNAGVGQLNYTLTPQVPWLSVSNPAGGPLASGQTTSHQVRITLGRLIIGPRQGLISIQDSIASNTPQTVSVTLRPGWVIPPSKVVTWGADHGQGTVPTTLSNAVAIAGGAYHSVAIRSDGTIEAWGGNLYGQTDVPIGITNAASVAAGYFHSVVVLSNGQVKTWGFNNQGQTDAPYMTSAISAGAGYLHSLVVRTNGTVAAWGQNSYGQCSVPWNLTNAIAVAGGELHSIALLANGRVVTWGANNAGQSNIPPNITNAVAVAAGSLHSLALLSDGRVVAWGDNSSGQTNVPASITNAAGIAAGRFFSVALCNDGRVVVWGQNDYDQTNIPSGLTNVVGIAAGYENILALHPAQFLSIASAHGSAQPPAGSYLVTRDAPFGCQITNMETVGGTQFVSAGWIGSGSIPADGTSNSISFVVTNDSSITWLWHTNYWLSLDTSGAGNLSGSNAWVAHGTNVQIAATASEYHELSSWQGDTNNAVITNLVITLPMTSARSIVAVFDPILAAERVPEWWLAQFGMTNFDSDAMTDSDGDGLLSWEEWVSGTDPTNGTSVFKFTEAEILPQGALIRWPSVSNRFYTLSKSTGLTNGQGFVVLPGANNLPGTPPYNSYTDSVTGPGPYYYRLDVHPRFAP